MRKERKKKKNNMNNGFTLIELLGVVALLTLILSVAIPSLVDSNKKSDDNTKKAFKETLLEACVNYLEINSESSDTNIQELFKSGTPYTFPIREKLVLGGYLKNNLEDPYKDNMQVGSSSYNGQIKATFVDGVISCDYVENIVKPTPTVSLTAKTVTYNGSAIEANAATVSPNTGGDLSYVYYSDSSCSTPVTTLTGAASAGAAPKNAGTYYVKAKVGETTNYKAAFSSCVAHTINKKAPTLNLSSTTASVGYNNGTASVTYTYDGDGTVSCESSNTNYATCSVNTSNKTITITGKAYTNTKPTITIKAAAGINYSAATDKTITVTLTDGVKPTVSLSPNTQSTYVSGGKAVTVTLADAGSGLKASQTVSYAWSTSNTTVPTNFTNLTTSNTAGAASTTVTVPASASASLTGTYYLWIKVGTVADVLGNTNAVKTSGAFKFDNTMPSGSITFTGTKGTVVGDTDVYVFGTSVGTAPYASSSSITDGHSGVKSSSLTCQSGNTAVVTVSNASTSKVNVTIKSRKGTANSYHYLQEVVTVTCTLKVTDNAGNTKNISSSAKFGNGWYGEFGCPEWWNYINGMNKTKGWIYTYWYKTDNTVYYYLDSSGSMLKGWQKIGGYWYYLHDDCALGTYKPKSDYEYPSGGMMWSDTLIRKSDNAKWDFDKNGHCISGSGC